MSQHSLQEQPQDPKKHSKVLYCRRFCGFRSFWQDRAQDPKKVAKMLPKVRQVGHLGFQVGHLGAQVGNLGAKVRQHSVFLTPVLIRVAAISAPSLYQETPRGSFSAFLALVGGRKR